MGLLLFFLHCYKCNRCLSTRRRPRVLVRRRDLLLLSRLHGDTQFPCVCPVSSLLHTLEHPLDEGAIVVEEGRLSHFSLAVEVAEQY